MKLILLAVIVLTVAAAGCDNGIKVVVTKEPVMSDVSPLVTGKMGRAPLEEFEAAVKAHPEWVNQKSRRLPDPENLSPLTAYAISAETNHVRALIRNAADVAESLAWCQRNRSPECADLISNVCQEVAVTPKLR